MVISYCMGLQSSCLCPIMSAQVDLVLWISLLLFYISSSDGQCVGKVLVSRTSSNCRGQFMFGCGVRGSNLITGPLRLCDEIGITEGCKGTECDRTWDLIQDDCQSSIENTVPTIHTLQPGIKPDNVDCTEDLINAIRMQSALGALVGLLSLILAVVIIGWVRTYLIMRGRGETRRNVLQMRTTPIRMANNPAYVHRNEDDASGDQTQNNTYESITDH